MGSKLIARNASLYVFNATGGSVSLTGDTNSVSLSRSGDTPEVTAFGNTTRERIAGGLTDWELSINGFFTEGANSVDETLSDLMAQDTVIIFSPSGSGTGASRFSGSALLNDYSVEFPVDGAATITAKFVARAGSLTKDTW